MIENINKIIEVLKGKTYEESKRILELTILTIESKSIVQ